MKQRSERIESIFQNFRAIRREFSHGSRFSSRHFGMTMTQASALMLLMQEGRKTMGEIASALGVSKSAASQLLEGLIEKGFVERMRDEEDKRVAYVSISRAGLRHFKHMRDRGGKRITQMFDLLDDTELEQIEAITTKLVERAKEIRE